mgnify:FL=1
MKNIIDSETLSRTIRRLSAEAVELEKGTENVVLIGIRTRGVILARRMQAEIEKLEGVRLPLGILDIALYRDDLLSGSCDAVFKGSEIDFDVEGKKVILCDDVLYTGRTVRAALAALSALGRAESVRLFCLVDRGHRELPFRADGVGKNVPTSSKERVIVRFKETDGEDGAYITT